ncbi:gluconolaconase [Mucilaginibacter terrae]|uniref:gluconolaconase n=1 Tax=Mucilaginibacter terrae TaxID=1955052 RepID=UPI00362536FA
MTTTKYIIASLALLMGLGSQAQTPQIKFMAPGVYPEGVAYNNKNNMFYVSSVTTGTIGTVDMQGNYKTIYTDPSLKSTYGLKLDPKQNLLWACVSDGNYSQYSDSSTYKKMGRLIAIDIITGKKIHDINLAKQYKGQHFINDMAFDATGNIYVTDSYSPVVYKIDKSGKASVFAKSELFESIDIGLNGIVYHPLGFLIVNNNSKGAIYKIDMKNPQNITRVKVKTLFPGADGMLIGPGGSIIVVQNKSVDKVHQLTSTDNWQTAEVQGSTTAEDRYQQPSTGTMANGQVYVLNSKMNELADPTKHPSKEFSIQLVQFRPAK